MSNNRIIRMIAAIIIVCTFSGIVSTNFIETKLSLLIFSLLAFTLILLLGIIHFAIEEIDEILGRYYSHYYNSKIETKNEKR